MVKNLFLLLTLTFTFLFSNELSLTKLEKEYLLNKKSLNLCVDPNWMPYEMIKDTKHIGMTADYIKILEKNINIEIKLVQSKTWSQSLELGKKRKCDMFSLIMPTKSRLKYLDFTKAYFDIPLVISTQIHELFIDDISHLKGKKIGIVKDYAYTEIIKTKYPFINLVYVENVKDGLTRLQNNDFFGFIGTLYTVGYQIQNDFVGKLKIAGKFDERWELGIATRNDEPLLKSILDKAILTVPKKEKQEIFNKWLSIVYEKSYFSSMISILVISFFIIIFVLLINRKLNSEIRKRKEAKKLLNLTISSAKLGTWSWNPKTNKNETNDIWAQIIGYKKDDIKDLSDFFTLIHSEDIPLINEEFKKHENREKLQYEVEFRMLCKDGNYKWIYSNGSIVKRDKDDKPTLVVGIHQDIDQRKKLEQEVLKQKDLFIQKSRQAAMGEMLENIAHQWRQPLSVITTVASGLKISNNLNMTKKEDIDDSMEQIIKSGMYLSQTIEDFRSFLNKDRVKSKVNIKKLIHSATYFFKSQVQNKKIDLVLNIDDIIIEVYENELLQSLLNIINNAFDALNEKDIEKKCIIIDAYKDEENCIICIKDNAFGIEKENLLKIFEPYFTTKHKSVGTGIGLYMTHEIITKHLFGKIEASNVDFKYLGKDVKGACFKITLAKKMKKN